MNLKRVKTFMLIIDHKNFSTVADILKVSQPAVSKQIKALETELGVALLHRDSLMPTEAGRFVYQNGRELLELWEQLEEGCHLFQQSLTGQIKVGASSIPSSYIVPSVLKNFINLYPQLEIIVSEHESEEVLTFIKSEKLDIGFVGSTPSSDEFNYHLIAKDHLLLIGPTDSDDIAGFNDIKGLPFIFRSNQSGTWKSAQEALHAWGGSLDELNCLATVHSTESVLAMVESGLGYSIVSDMATKTATNFNRVKILAELPSSRNFYCVYSRYKQNSSAIKAFIDVVKREFHPFA